MMTTHVHNLQVFYEIWLEPRGVYYAALFIILSIVVCGAIFLEVKRFKRGEQWQQLPPQEISVLITPDTHSMEMDGSDRRRYEGNSGVAAAYFASDEPSRSMLASGAQMSA
jgi:hypothetical protein